jgi:hypothetical protein
MAAPNIIAGNPANKQLYVVHISMSSPYFTIKEKTVVNPVENSKKMYYRFPLVDRQRIQAIRQGVNVQVGAGCARFYELKITNDTGKEQLEEAIRDAHQKMILVDPTLKAESIFIPLSMAGMAQGNLLDAMVTQIREQIDGAVLKQIEAKIEKYGDNINPKSKATLLKMLDRIKSVNILDDPDIDAHIEEMKQRILNDQIVPLQQEILAIMNEDKDRFSTVDVVMPGDIDDTAAIAVDESELPVPEKETPKKKHKTSSMITHRISVEDMD